MPNNIYGGVVYPHSSFVFDHVYHNYKEAEESVKTGALFVGRYILICYCPQALETDDRVALEQTGKLWDGTIPEEGSAGDLYLKNLKIDNNDTTASPVSNDRKVYRVKYNNGYELEEITCLNNTIGKSQVNDLIKKVDNIIKDAPETFDTLVEIADWINNDETGAAAMANQILNLEKQIEWQTF